MDTLAIDEALPFDVRLMNGVAGALYALVGAGVAAAAVLWLARSPWLPIRVIEIDGDLQRTNVATIRANATPKLAGNFLSIDLKRAQAAFESVPWVRQATLHRVWPDRLGVHLVEHQPVALWVGDGVADQLVNDHGEVFQANVGDVEDDGLPAFDGPPGSAAAMLAVYRRLAPVFAPLGRPIATLHLSGRGSWRVDLDGGARIEIGRGSDDELAARSERFVRTVGQVTERWLRGLQTADLRHVDGYAVRLEGITTGVAPAAAKKTTKP